MIWLYKDDVFQEQQSLLQALGIAGLESPVISVVGGGGKTTVVTRMFDEYANQRRHVVLTTTTHMRKPDGSFLLSEPSLTKLKVLLHQEGRAFLGEPVADRKVRSLPEFFLKEVCGLRIPLIIEADGAKGKPCKAPAEHEPVLLSETTHVIGVFGLDAVGQSLAESCHRPEKVAEVLGKSQNEVLTCEDIAALCLSRQGARKSVLPAMEFAVILNKADNRKMVEYGACIAKCLSDAGIQRILLTTGLTKGDII